MTTIVITEEHFAVDGRIADGNHIVSEQHSKWVRYGDNIRLWTGNVHLENIILKNENLSQIDPDLLVEETDCIIEITRCETREYGKYKVLGIREYYKNPDTKKVHVMTVTQFPYVAGSGDSFAKGALLGGASPSEAVVIASKCDIRTGGLVTQMSLINGDIVTVNC